MTELNSNIQPKVKESTLEKIHKAALRFLAQSTLEETYKIIVDEAMKLVNADSGSIFLQTKEGFKIVYATNLDFYKTIPRKNANTYQTFVTGKPRIADISDIGKAHPEVRNKGIKQAIFVPLSYQGRANGVLVVNTSHRGTFTVKELGILIIFGSLVSLGIRKAQLYEEIKGVLEIRDLFVTMASHELRTPLTSIHGYAQLLYSKLSGTDSVESRWIELLLWECQRMTYLVNELLTTNQIKSGELEYKWKECNLNLIVSRAIANTTMVYPSINIVFEDRLNGSRDTLIGDFDKLIQGIGNLIENACKFSATNGIVKVTISYNKPNLLLEIQDQGIGISKKDLPKVFDKFYRGQEHTREGMGIGMFIAKEVISKHHGVIKVSSRLKKGTKITIKFPRAKI